MFSAPANSELSPARLGEGESTKASGLPKTSPRRRNEKSKARSRNEGIMSLPEEAATSPQITFNYPERTSWLDRGTMPLKDDLITPVNEKVENTDHLFWAENLDQNDDENFGSTIGR